MPSTNQQQINTLILRALWALATQQVGAAQDAIAELETLLKTEAES
jgi:hypothetical protein